MTEQIRLEDEEWVHTHTIIKYRYGQTIAEWTKHGAEERWVDITEKQWKVAWKCQP